MVRWPPPSVVYLIVGGSGILLLCILTPPFEVPDEPQHFYRSYQLSRLELWGRIDQQSGGAVLPSSLPQLVELVRGTRANHEYVSPKRHPWTQTWRLFSIQLEPGRQEFVEFTEAASYAPVGYLPQAAAIAVFRAFGAPPLLLLYAARLANAGLTLLFVTWLLRRMPTGQTFAMVVALLPMSQFQTASASQDPVVLVSSLAVIVTGLRGLAYRRWSRADALLAVGAGASLCLTKPVYFPLLFTALPAARSEAGDPIGTRRNKRRLFAWCLLSIIIALVLSAAWTHSASAITMLPRHDATTDMKRQLAFIVENFPRYIWILSHTIVAQSDSYYRSAIGILGWLTVPLAWWMYPLCSIALAAAILQPPAEALRLDVVSVLWILGLAVACVVLVETALYLLWTPVGHWRIIGVQGRYFLSVVPLLGAIPPQAPWLRDRPAAVRSLYPAIVAATVVATAGTVDALLETYGIL